jgi:hypothetical protein
MQSNKSSNRVWEELFSFMHDFRMFSQGEKDVASASSQIVHSPIRVWHPPPDNFFKINWDASVAPNGNQIGLGLVVRDSKGDCICAIILQ